MAEREGGSSSEMSLKDQGNEFFKSGKYLKAAALYTQAIKQDPSNPTLYSNRAAALLQLDKLNKALDDAEMTIKLKPEWEKGYFRKGSILEAMKRYDDALAAFEIALQYNPQSQEVTKKIKRINQLVREGKRAQEVENMRSNVDMAKHLQALKPELSGKYGSEECWKDMFAFLVETMETAVKSWHETSKLDARVYFLLDKEKTQTDKYAPIVNIDKVWKGQGSRKWKHAQNDGFFVQFETPSLRKLWFIPSSNEKGQTLCRDPDGLDIGAHEILPRLFKENLPSS
ncbi:stress-induced-phosphoprotein 1 isoform X3 [Arachis ipaensis]|uniref:stress-induced-phosphoprotein 1 isoform X3 n=1 Tax=Arachis ipaensis TaxID=130454 RepID=UPI000A2AF648|nr:stress-induced-phosphoprotein 1 isoform X3 [Arachis ipaensis]